MECKRDLYSNFMKVRQKSIRAADTEKESAKMKRQQIFSASSASLAHRCIGSSSIQLLYENLCILCNQYVQLFKNNPEIASKKYRVPDNLTADPIKNSLLRTAHARKDDWGIEVIGRL